MNIRPEQPPDIDAIRQLNRAAFETRAEADLVDLLRENARPFISLVAEDDGTIVGHIMFSPVTISPHADVTVMGLAPMAVLPARQRQGIGSALVAAGLDECRRLAVAGIVVLGHAHYYPRFGFRAASGFGLRSEYDVPDDVFMALELEPSALCRTGGTVRYHPAFAMV